MIFRRTADPLPEPYAWTMAHPEFREAQESEEHADAWLLLMSEMVRELALAEAEEVPGGWTPEEVTLFWKCELRYPYMEERKRIQSALPPEKIPAFQKELACRRNNAAKRKGRPPPVWHDLELGNFILVEPIRADLPLIPVLMIRL